MVFVKIKCKPPPSVIYLSRDDSRQGRAVPLFLSEWRPLVPVQWPPAAGDDRWVRHRGSRARTDPSAEGRTGLWGFAARRTKPLSLGKTQEWCRDRFPQGGARRGEKPKPRLLPGNKKGRCIRGPSLYHQTSFFLRRLWETLPLQHGWHCGDSRGECEVAVFLQNQVWSISSHQRRRRSHHPEPKLHPPGQRLPGHLPLESSLFHTGRESYRCYGVFNQEPYVWCLPSDPWISRGQSLLREWLNLRRYQGRSRQGSVEQTGGIQSAPGMPHFNISEV